MRTSGGGRRFAALGVLVTSALLASGCASRVNLAGTDPLATLGAKATPSATAAAAGAGNPPAGATLSTESTTAALPSSVASSAPATPKTSGAAAVSKPATATTASATRSATASTSPSPAAKAKPLVKKPVNPALAPLVVGTISSVTGSLASHDTGVPAVVQAWAAQVNQTGGLDGRQVDVVTADDGGDSTKALAAVKSLVEKKKVTAFIGNWMPLTAEAVRPYLEQKGIPVIGGDLISTAWTDSPVFFPQGAPLHPQALAAVPVASGDPSGTTYGLIYCTEDPGCQAAYQQQVVQGGAAAAGLKVVYDTAVPRNAPSYTGICFAAMNAKVAVLAIAAPLSTVRAIALDCSRTGYQPQYSYLTTPDGVSSTEAGATAPTPEQPPFGIFAPLPDVSWTTANTPATQAFHTLLAASKLTATSATQAAYISTQLFAAAAAKLDKQAITSASLISALDALAPDALSGLTPPLHFTKDKATPANPCYFGIQVTQTGLVPVGTGAATCS